MKIGNIDLHNGILLAPMEDVTDLPFRVICKRLGADIVYTEFVNSEGLVRGSKKTQHKMTFWEEERPIGIQIYGGEISSMAGAAQLAESFHPDLIDINCGCWVKDVAMRGAGAGLLRDLPKMEKIASTVVNAVKTPVTLKTRLGWDKNSIRIVDVARMCETVGIKALTVHCRTRDQGHKGEVDYSWIPRIKEAVSIPVIVNGDIVTPQNVKGVFDATGADAVMLGRGAVLNPWIFRQAKHFLATGSLLPEPTVEDRVNLLKEHLKLSVEFKGERSGVIELRKHYSGFLRGLPHVSRIRMELMQFTEAESILEHLTRFLEHYSPPGGIIPKDSETVAA
ncbi:MAG TPA: tRNA dihydrouridine synthase DusB [Bacteroidetes bacterium]|nr:tRNA dihydrouridine synthase DusB [Bacteroidota bacterium]